MSLVRLNDVSVLFDATPVLQASVLIVGMIYMVSTLLADLLIAFLNPRVRLDAGT